MPQAEYEVRLLDRGSGIDLATVGDFEYLDYVNRVGHEGFFEVGLPSDFDMAQIEHSWKDSRLVVWRKPHGGMRTIDFAGFVRYKGQSYQDGRERLILKGYHYNSLLYRRVVAYPAGTTQSQKYLPCEELMKEVVDENFGTGADAARDLVTAGYMEIQPAIGIGTTVWKYCARKRVLDVLKEVSESSLSVPATAGFFGIVPEGNGWGMEFQVRIGQWGNDHRHPDGVDGAHIFALERGNVAEIEWYEDALDETTYIYALGPGDELSGIVLPVYDTARMNDTPLNRIEETFQGGEYEYISLLGDAGRSFLEERKPRKVFSFGLAETENSRYGVDWGLGDQVTGAYRGEQYDFYIQAVHVRLEGNAESVEPVLEKLVWE